MGSESVIVLDSVTKVLGKKPRIDGLSFDCEPGRVYGLLGPNGAGKTTLMNLITGLYRPTSGTVRVLGLDPVRDARKVRREIGLVPQETSLYPELSALENLRFHAALYLDDQRMAERRIDEVLELVDLADRAKDAVGSYSGGMKRRLALGRAMLADPRILLLDEPTLGVDVQGTHRIWDYVRRFKGEGRTVLVSTNVMAEADALADEILLLDHGRKVRFGTPDALKAEAGSTVVRITSVSGSRVDEAALRGRLDGFSFDGESIVVDAPGGEADLARILGLVEGAVEIAGVELHRPTLDDAFLALTGRSLRD
ncbi:MULTISPECIES: ABC transporter ATP-binding protein [Gordonibacter]|uniref:ABC transporter ATP-binding protein n=1 Tax=Gordonibacter faecis TaxID=3047475 RepID=A0ABT7DLY9_9ACTN|nr:ABC transporter ATP-binding protein [Gordonibacter sp. KGMB12511]MDJ1650559.1 ABC transporter ATP-binding protein [Gordonibacter sp. KGMB12511]